MGIFEIISAIVFIIACVFIIIVVLMKETKTQMSQTISGSSADSFYQKNAGRTKEAMLNKATIVAAVVFFVLAVLVNVFNVYFGAEAEGDTGSASSSAVTESDGSAADEDDLGVLAVTLEESEPAQGDEPQADTAEGSSASDGVTSADSAAETSNAGNTSDQAE